MKTLAFKYLKLFLLAVAMVNLTSCEIEIDDFYDDDNIGGSYYNKSLDLCSRTWADTFYDADGNYCYQELNFYLDRHGEDYIRVEYPNGRYSESVYSFTWNWEDRSQYSLRMVYGPGDVSYLDDVWIRGNVLSGDLDGHDNYVDFTGVRSPEPLLK